MFLIAAWQEVNNFERLIVVPERAYMAFSAAPFTNITYDVCSGSL